MDWLLVLLLTLVPGALWVWFFYRQDSHAREPIGRVVLTFGLGMLSILPAAWAEAPFRDLLANPPNSFVHLASMILVVGLVEETSKFLAFYFAAYRSSEFDEPVDGIVYGSIAGLGFATVENILYASTFGIAVAPVRAAIASLAHASFSGLVGFYAGRVKLLGEPWTVGLYGIVVAAALHGFYNFIVLDGTVPPLFAIPLVYLVYRHLAGKIVRARSWR